MDIYIKQDGRANGPFSLQEIINNLAASEIDHEVEARFEGSGGWVSLSQVPGLGELTLAPLNTKTGKSEHTTEQSRQAVTAEWDKGDDLYAVLPNAVKMSLYILFAPLEKGLSDPPKIVYSRETIYPAGVQDAFMASAAKFTEVMPGVFATFLRDISESVNVQATTTKTLEKGIREEAFSKMEHSVKVYFRRDEYGTLSQAKQGLELFYAALKEMPAPLVDYLSTKHFGMSIDMDKQQDCINASVAHCENLVERAKHVLAELIRMREAFEREQRSQEHLQATNAKSGCAFVLLAMAVTLVAALTTARLMI